MNARFKGKLEEEIKVVKKSKNFTLESFRLRCKRFQSIYCAKSWRESKTF